MNKTKWFLMQMLIISQLLTSCGSTSGTYSDMRNYTLTSIDVRNSKIHVEGRLNSSLIIVDSYADRLEENEMLIKIYLAYPNRSSKRNVKDYTATEFEDSRNAIKHLSICFEQSLPDNIEKVFIEDDKNKIMIWERSQGYDIFEIESSWKTELQKLK